MANKTIYLTDEGEAVFKRAKEIAGDSISSVITMALKKYVLQEVSGLHEIRLWIGEQRSADDLQGKRIKFVGKKLSEGKKQTGKDHYLRYELYYTRKGQFLLYEVDEDREDGIFISTYDVYPEFKELKSLDLPGSIIIEAEKQLPDVPCEELDI